MVFELSAIVFRCQCVERKCHTWFRSVLSPDYPFIQHGFCQTLDIWYILINTLRPRQCGRQFADDMLKMIFFDKKCCTLLKLHWIFSHGSLHASIGLYNGLVSNTWQAIIWSNDGLLYRLIHALLNFSELKQKCCTTKTAYSFICHHPWSPV